MTAHYTTFVLPKSASGLDYDVPFFVVGDDQGGESGSLPTSLHRHGHEVMPFSHASMMTSLGPERVSDVWIDAVEQYDRAAKIVVVLDPVPADITTEYADVGEGVTGLDLPPWVGDLLNQRLRAAVRDVPVTAGDDALSIGIDPTAPTTLPDWAHQNINPGQ